MSNNECNDILDRERAIRRGLLPVVIAFWVRNVVRKLDFLWRVKEGPKLVLVGDVGTNERGYRLMTQKWCHS